MADNQIQPNESDRPEQAKPEEISQQARQSQAGKLAQQGQRTAPGRKPLFRN